MQENKSIVKPQSDLLITKLTAPLQRARIVKRPRLTNILRTGMSGKLCLVVAPAGYGKTTLIRDWMNLVDEIGWPVAWLSLDEDDNALLQFWSYILAAIQTVIPDFYFESFKLSTLSGESFDQRQFSQLLNQIASIPKQFSLVLDDFHVIQDTQIHHSVEYFIAHLPDNFHLVIASRVHPPLHLARLEVLGQMAEILASDLTFTHEEARVFLEKVMEIRISGEDVVGLNRLSEGWIVGLQLAGVSLKGGHDAKSLMANFTGKSHQIVAYLTEEVLNWVESSVKNFLLQTSILSRLSAPLCDGLLGISNSQDILQELEKTNQLITPLDETRHWYRYHALFAEFLRDQLSRKHPEMLQYLHQQAFNWLVANGLPEQAIPHALEAGETDRAADIVEASALHGLLHLDFLSTTQWLQRVPKKFFQERPQLTIIAAKLIFSLGIKSWYGNIQDELEKIYVRAQQLTDGQSVESGLMLQALVLKTTEICLEGKYEQGILISKRIVPRRHEIDIHTFGMMGHFLSFAYLAKGEMEKAKESLGYALKTTEDMDLYEEKVTTLCSFARVYKYQGKLHEALGALERAINIADAKGIETEAKDFICSGVGELYRMMGSQDLADQYSAKAQQAYARYGVGPRVWIYMPELPIHLAYNKMMHKDYSKASEYIQDAKYISQSFYQVPFLDDQITLCEVKYWIMNGDSQSISHWLEGFPEVAHAETKRLSPVLKLALARAWLVTKKPGLAIELLKNSSDLVSDHVHIHIERAVLLSTAYQINGDKISARREILKALLLAYPGSYISVFIEEGLHMKQLLKDISRTPNRTGTTSELSPEILVYVGKILSWFEIARIDDIKITQIPRVEISELDAVSKRELELLVLLSQGLETKQIASRLSISDNTVRTHLKNIFKKLEVHSRSEAVKKAIEQKLL